jgi:prepilin-type N-terminal cleavage/methylation domain-containing protein
MQSIPKRSSNRLQGFTLIEILVVAFIISVLAGLLIPTIIEIQRIAKDKVCKNQLRNIGVAMGMYLTQNNGFLPQGREKTSAGEQPPAVGLPAPPRWYKNDTFRSHVAIHPDFALSWQQILDKIMDAESRDGYRYTTSDYVINDSGSANLVNERGLHEAWKCPVAGTSQGMYFGNEMVFSTKDVTRSRDLKINDRERLNTGSINVERLSEAGANFESLPVCADGSSASTEERWLERYKKPAKQLDDDGDPIPHLEFIHMKVTGSFTHTVAAGNDSGQEFMNMDFRHYQHANVLTLNWNVVEWNEPDNGPLAVADEDSIYNGLKRTWDSLVILYKPIP